MGHESFVLNSVVLMLLFKTVKNAKSCFYKGVFISTYVSGLYKVHFRNHLKRASNLMNQLRSKGFECILIKWLENVI